MSKSTKAVHKLQSTRKVQAAIKVKKAITCLVTQLFCFALISLGATANANPIKHLEPANWWAQMASNQLQLMVHGDDISQYSVSVKDGTGITVQSVQTTDNPNYLFVNLILADDVKPGDYTLEFSHSDKTSFSHQYPIYQRQAGSAQRRGFDASDVIYLITPDRFVNGDLSNDEVTSMKEGINRSHPGGRHGGDIQGIIQRLDYISDMGFTQMWLNPVLENNMPTYSYHGYSTTDYYQVDPRYGDNELYISLAKQAKEKGVGLIKDVILNHIGSEHWWMKDMPASDWINNGGKFVGTTHLREAIHDPYAAEVDKKGFADGWFVPTMPDLNQRNPFLATYLIQNSIWWIETAHLSGIRLDTYSYPDKAFLSDWNARIIEEYPNFTVVGEEWTLNPAITAYWQRGSKRHDDYDSQLPSVFDFALQDAIVKSLTSKEAWNSGWITTYTSLANDFLFGDPTKLVTFPDNHDMSRIYSVLGEDAALTRMALTFFATTRGIPQYYYGTEILLPGLDDHGVIRTDFPGGWPSDTVNAFTGKGLTAEQQNTQSMLKKLLNWRKTSPAITRGNLIHYARENGTYTYFRYEGDLSVDNTKPLVMVVMNKNEEAAELSLDRFTQVLQNRQFVVRDVLNNKSFKLTNSLTIPAKTAAVFELVPNN